jgi:hypothetical protein
MFRPTLTQKKKETLPYARATVGFDFHLYVCIVGEDLIVIQLSQNVLDTIQASPDIQHNQHVFHAHTWRIYRYTQLIIVLSEF